MPDILASNQPIPLTVDQLKEMQELQPNFPPTFVEAYVAIDGTPDLQQQKEKALEARRVIETIIKSTRDKSLATAVHYHNVCKVPLIARIQQISDELARNLPTVTIDVEEVRQIVSETFYAAIRKATGKDHKRVNDLDGYEDEVALVTWCLLDAQMQDHETHGLNRVPRYVEAILNGLVQPNGKVELYHEATGIGRFDGHGTFGQVLAQIMVQYILEKLQEEEQGAIIAAGTKAFHAGRLEFMLRKLVEAGYQCQASMNVAGWGRGTFPDGVEGKFGTNPIGYGSSTGKGKAGIVADSATTMFAEGLVNRYRGANILLPFGVLRKPDGSDTIEPRDLYAKDDTALLLPLSPEHKGAALGGGLDLYVTGVCGRRSMHNTVQGGNNIVLVASKPGSKQYAPVQKRLADFAKCRTNSGQPIRLPGVVGQQKLQTALKEGVITEESTWRDVLTTHKQLCG